MTASKTKQIVITSRDVEIKIKEEFENGDGPEVGTGPVAPFRIATAQDAVMKLYRVHRV